MALKRPSALLALPTSSRTLTCNQCRALHKTTIRIPKPTPFVPDVPTFLTLIGRNLSQHASKIPSWEALFSLTSQQLRESGVEPARARRYLLWWRERFRAGITGIGGDVKEVKDGIAELRLVEVPSQRRIDAQATLTKSAGMRKMIINVTPSVSLPADPANPVKEGESEDGVPLVVIPKINVSKAQLVTGVKIVSGTAIGGTGVENVKGHQGVARLKVKEGLWEERRGHKVDGGERRKAEVRYKRRAQERKMAR
ncbi:telomere length regulation protein [Recurvomyces mirabilis]|uniref:Small ribosomal subunit protein mS41 n=1 Tax=Recurvomyces mirabilis TaxID=574656 RepID=A0AAE0WU68_9PEZI|nr:telomere length regulation protein [Recurvomyces mirabilis]KAK5157439.1 telomere length regulation protein [Recurvomyces mirabilis]